MHVALLFPPATDPRSPHLAIPSLAAALRGSGVRVSVRDLDLEGLLALLQRDALVEAVDEVRRRHDRVRGSDARAELGRLLDRADHVVERTGQALSILRDPDAFFDPHRLYAARNGVHLALQLVSSARPGVHYAISDARYDVDGIDPSRLVDLEAVTGDPRSNLFDDFWRDSLLPDLDRDRPDLVGISILNHQQIVPGLTLARLLKSHGHTVVIGGTVYAKFADRLQRRPRFFELFCDALVPREGETAMLSLLEHRAAGRDIGEVPNLMSLGPGDDVRLGPLHLENVAELPTPDFDGLPLGDYLAPAPVLPILTGKGCYFNRCKFCDIPYINREAGKPYRMRPADVVAADVAALHERHGARHFEITDETLSPRFLVKLGEALKDHPGTEARFVGYARFEPGFTAEVCQQLHAAGVRKLFFGLESGSQATLDHMDKGIKLPVASRVLRDCDAAGLAVHLFSIIGFPEETEDRARETLNFLLDHAETLDHPRHSFDIHSFSLDLRTAYYDAATDYGIDVDAGFLSARDFPITAGRWRNGRGLNEDDVRRLLVDYHAELRRRFAASRCYPDTLWPGFEEYAVLYGTHFEDQPFPWRMSLPPDGDPLVFRLLWAEGVQVVADGSEFTVSTLMGEWSVSPGVLGLLARPRRPLNVDEFLDTLAMIGADRAQVRLMVDALLAGRVLTLVPEDVALRSAVPV